MFVGGMRMEIDNHVEVFGDSRIDYVTHALYVAFGIGILKVWNVASISFGA